MVLVSDAALDEAVLLLLRITHNLAEGAGAADAIAQRCQQLRHEIARERYLSFDREKHQERLARLTSGVATLRVAGATATERADRIEGARAVVGAARAAFNEGVVPGGGAALLFAAQEVARTTLTSFEQRMLQRRAVANWATLRRDYPPTTV